jgi:hypothetical protein
MSVLPAAVGVPWRILKNEVTTAQRCPMFAGKTLHGWSNILERLFTPFCTGLLMFPGRMLQQLLFALGR